MREPSERLMSLLRGGRTARPPLWEPWFAMGDAQRKHYDGSYVAMALDLGHAAVPIGYGGVNANFRRPITEEHTTMTYGGGVLRTAEQLRTCPEPDWNRQFESARVAREAAREAGLACWFVLPWCFHTIATSMSLEHFSLACYDEPNFVHEAMAWVEARNRKLIERVIEPLSPDFVLYDGDCAYKTGTMIDPDMMRRFCFDPTLTNARLLQQLDIPLAFHTDGKLDDVIPIVRDLGVAAIHGCEKQANDLAHLVDRFGDTIALCGNMDVVFLKHATPDEVRAQTLRMLDVGSVRGRFIAGCNTSPQDYIPWENYVAMTRTIASFEPVAA